MSIEQTQAFLEQEIQGRIDSFKERVAFYRRRAFSLAIGVLIISSLTTVLIGVGEIYSSQTITVSALFLSGLLTVLSGWEAFFGHRQRWIQSNETLMSLYELRSDMAFKKTLSGFTEEDLNSFYSRYREVLRQANQQWKEARRQNATTPQPATPIDPRRS